MQLDFASLAIASCAAVFVGLSKTGFPGAAMPAVVLMAAAFEGNAQWSVGAMLVVLLVGDVLAVACFRRHAQWDRLRVVLLPLESGEGPAVFAARNAHRPDYRHRPGPVAGGNCRRDRRVVARPQGLAAGV
jgi:hypothetical protein